MAVFERACPICEACCGLLVTTNPNGDITSVKGDPDDPFSRGHVCPKSQAMTGVARDRDRLKRPILKVNGKFEEIEWDQAFQIAADRLRTVQERHGGKSIAFYTGNPSGNNAALTWYSSALIGLTESPQVYNASSIDAHPRLLTSALLYGDKTLTPIPDIDHCDFLLIVGANPIVSNGSMLTAPGIAQRLKAIQHRGGTLVVVDPRRTETAAIADEHLAIRASSDALLLLAMVHTLFDEGLVDLGTAASLVESVDQVRSIAAAFSPENVAGDVGIAPGRIRGTARSLASADRAVVYGRVGACCQSFGTLTCWLIDLLSILTGNLDRRGGAIFGRPIPSNVFVSDPYRGEQAPYDRFRTRVRGFPEFSRQYPCFVLAEEIETPGDGQVRALVSFAGNPILSFPNGRRLESAIGTLEFFLSLDFYLNETSRLADLVLPPIAHLERAHFTQHYTTYMVRSYAKYSPPVLPKPADSYDDWEIVIEIARRIVGKDRALFEREHLVQLIGRALAGTNNVDIPVEEALEKLEGTDGPEKIYDLLLRVGNFGDLFGARPGGMSLKRLQAAPHGIDLGPVPAGDLGNRLVTPSRKVQLAPPVIVEDIARLVQFRMSGGFKDENADPNSFRLASRRDVRSMNSWLHNVDALAKGRDRCVLFIHPDDATRLSLKNGQRVKVRTKVGEIRVPIAISDQVQIGVVSLPHGFGHDMEGVALGLASAKPGQNINLLLEEESIDVPSGNVAFNNLEVSLEAE